MLRGASLYQRGKLGLPAVPLLPRKCEVQSPCHQRHQAEDEQDAPTARGGGRRDEVECQALRRHERSPCLRYCAAAQGGGLSSDQPAAETCSRAAAESGDPKSIRYWIAAAVSSPRARITAVTARSSAVAPLRPISKRVARMTPSDSNAICVPASRRTAKTTRAPVIRPRCASWTATNSPVTERTDRPCCSSRMRN